MTLNRKLVKITLVLLCLPLLHACGTVQKAQYAAYEKVGVHKRDILVDRIEATSDSQQKAQADFQSAYEELAELIELPASEMDNQYKRLAKSVDRSEARSSELKKRINAVDAVAQALFEEWQGELEQYTNDRLRQSSANKLAITQQRYAKIHDSMVKSHANIQPVLEVLQDNTLFLKHNLNARAVSGLSSEVGAIGDQVKSLIAQMEASIAESKAFMQQMNAG